MSFAHTCICVAASVACAVIGWGSVLGSLLPSPPASLAGPSTCSASQYHAPERSSRTSLPQFHPSVGSDHFVAKCQLCVDSSQSCTSALSARIVLSAPSWTFLCGHQIGISELKCQRRDPHSCLLSHAQVASPELSPFSGNGLSLCPD